MSSGLTFSIETHQSFHIFYSYNGDSPFSVGTHQSLQIVYSYNGETHQNFKKCLSPGLTILNATRYHVEKL